MATGLPASAAASASSRLFQPSRRHVDHAPCVPRRAPTVSTGVALAWPTRALLGRRAQPPRSEEAVALDRIRRRRVLYASSPWWKKVASARLRIRPGKRSCATRRLNWVDEGFEMLVFTDNSIEHEDLRKELSCCDMLVNVAVTCQETVQWLMNNSKDISNVICFHSSPSLVNKLGGTYVQYTGEQDMFGKLANIGKPSGIKESAEVLKTISNAWERHNSDDIRFACLLWLMHT